MNIGANNWFCGSVLPLCFTFSCFLLSLVSFGGNRAISFVLWVLCLSIGFDALFGLISFIPIIAFLCMILFCLRSWCYLFLSLSYLFRCNPSNYRFFLFVVGFYLSNISR